MGVSQGGEFKYSFGYQGLNPENDGVFLFAGTVKGPSGSPRSTLLVSII